MSEFVDEDEKKLYDDFHEYWTDTFQSSPEFLALGGQIQTQTFTSELSKWVENGGKV